MTAIVLTVILGAALCTAVHVHGFRRGYQVRCEDDYRDGQVEGFARGCAQVAADSNAMLNRELPAALERAKVQGASNCAQLLLPLLTAHGLELEAIALLTRTNRELAGKERN